MAEVDQGLLLDMLTGLRADIHVISNELRERREELRQQTGAMARRLDASEARLTLVERHLEARAVASARFGRKLDVVLAALAPTLPPAAQQMLAGEPEPH